jgi:xyloglucan-specific exo-beta-1,4-glucanase
MKKLAILLALLLATPVAAGWFKGSGVVTFEAPVFSTMRVGGAGAALKVNRNADGSKLLVTTDQYGCYQTTVGSGLWTQLARYDNLPTNDNAKTQNGAPSSPACDEVVFAPSNSNHIWMMLNESVVKSTDAGVTFTNTCYPAATFGPFFSASPAHNGVTKAIGPYIAVDPANTDVVYMSKNGSMQFTYDGGTTCSSITGVGSASNQLGAGFTGGYLIAFDTSGGNISTGTGVYSGLTRTKNIYVSTYGTGVYKSTDGGQTWSLLNTSNMPTTHVTMKVDPFGTLWHGDDNRNAGLGELRKYVGTTWTTVTAAGINIDGFDYDPNSCSSAGTCKLVGMLGGGYGSSGMSVSYDGGANWVLSVNIVTDNGDLSWLADLQNGGFGVYTGQSAFDNTGKIWTASEGVLYATPITTNAQTIHFIPQVNGIEESLSSSLVTSPTTSTHVILATWDVNCFYLTQPFSAFPTTAGGGRGCYATNGVQLQRAYMADYASANTSTIVALTDSQIYYPGSPYFISWSGISTDGGVNWSQLQIPTAVFNAGYAGGCIAASSTSNILLAPTDGSGGYIAPYYTTDGGTNWTQITVSGITINGGWPWRMFNSSKQCAADRVAANTFYLYNWNAGDGSGDALIKCVSSGATCTVASRPALPINSQYGSAIKTVPGQSGHIFMSHWGNLDGTNGGLYYNTAGGTGGLTQIANWTGVVAFGFGAAAPDSSYPTIVAVGWYNGTYGIYQSKDWDTSKTWQKIGDYPKNSLQAIQDVDGDKVIHDVFYYTGSSGTYCSAKSTAYCNGPN